MTVRPATKADLPRLYAALEQGDHEQVDLERSIVFVAEEGEGQLAGFVAARLTWQVEPLMAWPENKGVRRRAAVLLAQAMDQYLRSQGALGLGCYYAYIRDVVVQRLAQRFGLRRVYQSGGIFLREF